MSADDQSGSDVQVVFLLGLIFIVPLLMGAGLYLVCRPVHRQMDRWKTSFVFWAVVGGGFVLGLIIWMCMGALGLAEIVAITQAWFLKCFLHWGLSWRMGAVAAKCMTVSCGFSLVFAFVILPFLERHYRKEGLAQEDYKKDIPVKESLFSKYRSGGLEEGIFLGIDKQAQKPVYLKEADQWMHTQVLGATGYGKTSSVLLPMIVHNMAKGHGMVIIDGKAEWKFKAQLESLVAKYNREKDYQFFSTVFVKDSLTYNPFLNGSPTDQKDQLVGSQIFTEEFYKKRTEQILHLLFNVFQDQGVIPTIRRLEKALRYPKKFRFIQFKNEDLEMKWQEFVDAQAKNLRDYAGIAADLSNISDCDFGHLFESEGEGINLLDSYIKNKIVYFHLPVLKNEETVKRIGRMIIHDLKVLAALIQTKPTVHPHFYPVYIDEFASFAFPPFIEFLNKARSAGLGTTIFHQSMGDLNAVGDHYGKQIMENTNNKVILRVDDPETIENYCKMIGTRRTVKYTYQTEKFLFSRWRSGGASLREVDEYIVDPNEFRNLRIGEGIVIIKSLNKVARVKLDQVKLEATAKSFIERESALLAVGGIRQESEKNHEEEKDPSLFFEGRAL